MPPKRKRKPPDRQKTGLKPIPPPVPTRFPSAPGTAPAAAPLAPLNAVDKISVGHRNLRQLAKIDYVTDPEDRTIRFHYERPDRDYREHVVLRTFENWCAEDQWTQGRSLYYREIERRIIADRMEQLVEQRFRELDEISEDLIYLREWVRPLRNEDGTVRRHPAWIEEVDRVSGTYVNRPNPWAGLPVYAIPFRSMEKIIDAFLKLDERLMLKRGDATTRTESVDGGERPSVLDPKTTIVNKPTKDEVQAMARALLLQRQPGLLESNVIDVQHMTEHGSATGDGNTI